MYSSIETRLDNSEQTQINQSHSRKQLCVKKFYYNSKITDVKCILIDTTQYDVYLYQMAR